MNKQVHLALWAFIGITCCIIACGNNDEDSGTDESLAVNTGTQSSNISSRASSCQQITLQGEKDKIREKENVMQLSDEQNILAKNNLKNTCEAAPNGDCQTYEDSFELFCGFKCHKINHLDLNNRDATCKSLKGCYFDTRCTFSLSSEGRGCIHRLHACKSIGERP